MAKGLTATADIRKLWDVNPSFGGPIVRDKLWFFGTFRYLLSRQGVASMWVNKNAGDPTKWTYDPDKSQQAVNDGVWKDGTRAADVAADAAQQDQCLVERAVFVPACEQGGDGTGLGFGASIRSPEAYTTNENHPSMLTQIAWQSPVTARLLLEANAQLGAVFLVGQPSEESVRHDDDSGAGNGGAIPNINYRAENWSGHSGLHEHRQRRRFVHHRVTFGEGRLPLPPEHRQLPDQLLQQHAAEVPVHRRRPQCR